MSYVMRVAEVSFPQDPDFAREHESMECSTPEERIRNLKFYLEHSSIDDCSPAICYQILKEQCGVMDSTDLRSTIREMLELPYSQAKEAYKELSDFFLRNYSLCQEDGLSRREGEELLREIEEAETRWQACSPEFSLSRYLRETTRLKNRVKEWVECPLLFFVNKGVDALSNRVDELSISMIIRSVNPEEIVSHENKISTIQPVNRKGELSAFYEGIARIWNRDFGSLDSELEVDCVIEVPSISLKERHKFFIL